MNKSDFISNLIRKLDDCDTLDRQNYNDEKTNYVISMN